MRMWMVNTNIMCRKHLLGEHVECHMILGSMKKGIRLDKFVENNLLQLGSLVSRHDQLSKEMELRGFKHKSLFDEELFNSIVANNHYYSYLVQNSKVDSELSLIDLTCRCSECSSNYKNDSVKDLYYRCKFQ